MGVTSNSKVALPSTANRAWGLLHGAEHGQALEAGDTSVAAYLVVGVALGVGQDAIAQGFVGDQFFGQGAWGWYGSGAGETW
jgi:hypothetical protein